MKFRLMSTAAGLCVLSGMVSARAADVIEEPPYVPPVEVVSTSGWYLRGDAGYVFKSKTSGDYAFYNQFPGVQGIDDVFDYEKIELQETGSFGVGAGYRFTDHLRTDVTLDYFKADAKGSTSCASYVTASLGLDFYNDCAYDDSSEAEIWTAMANAYVDIATYGRITPYVGAGLGFSHVKYGQLRNEQVCGSDPACDGLENYVGYHEGESSWRFAASLMAGASISLTERLKLDAGYRYTRISEGDAFGFDEADKSFGASGVQGRDDGFDIHAIRAGLRYEFGGASGFGGHAPAEPAYADAPAYAPAPVYKP